MARSVDSTVKTSRFIVLLSVCVVVTALYFARDVLIPLALAVLFSFLFTPAVRWLEHRKVPRIAATLIVVCAAMAMVGSVGYVVAKQIKSVVGELPNYRDELRIKIDSLKRHGNIVKKAEEEFHVIGTVAANTHPATTSTAQVKDDPLNTSKLLVTNDAHGALTKPNPETPVPVRLVGGEMTPFEMIGEYATKFLSPLATTALVLILIIFMLLTRDDLRDRIIRLIGHGRLNLTTQALDEAGSRISRYLAALAIVNTTYGACVAGGLALIGRFLGHGVPFPNVLVCGLLVGLFRFVPYLGIFIGAALPLLLSFALFPGTTVFLAVVAMFVALEIIVSQFIEPYWYGASTGMSPLAVLISAVVWTWLWGPIGLLLSTPMTVCLVVMGKYIPDLQFLDILLGDEPVLPPHVRVYQRLVAGEEEEAADMTRGLLKEKSLEALYDEVLVPTLAMAEHDHHQGRLETEQLRFVHQSIREIVDELGEDAPPDIERPPEVESQDEANSGQSFTPSAKPRLPLPKDCVVNVLCLPAKGESDEIVAIMLKQLLERRRYYAFTTSADSLASEMVQMIEKQNAQIVCVSAMPPAAVAHSRYLCKRIHARYPDISLAVGVWLTRSDPQKVKLRIGCTPTVQIVTTLAQAQEQIDQMARRFTVLGPSAPEPAIPERPAVVS